MKGGKVFTFDIIDHYQVKFRLPFEKTTFLKREKFPITTFSSLEPHAHVRGALLSRGRGRDVPWQGEPFPQPVPDPTRGRSLSSCAPSNTERWARAAITASFSPPPFLAAGTSRPQGQLPPGPSSPAFLLLLAGGRAAAAPGGTDRRPPLRLGHPAPARAPRPGPHRPGRALSPAPPPPGSEGPR